MPTAQAIKPGDSLGTNGSKFFPIGLWYNGNIHEAYGAEGGPPDDANDATLYYNETLQQLKAIGINLIVHPNADDCHGDKLLATVVSTGGIYVIHEPTVFRDVPVTCLWPVDETVSLNGASAAASRFSSSPALAGFALRDEATDNCTPSMRSVTKYLDYSEQVGSASLHPGFATVTTVAGYGEHGPVFDAMTGLDALTFDGYPLDLWTPVGSAAALEPWGDSVSLHYQQTPTDKPLWYILQAHHVGYGGLLRDPTPAELRYMTYAALARGVQGVIWFMYQREFDLANNPVWPIDPWKASGGIADLDFNLTPNGREVQHLASELRILAPWLAAASRDDAVKNGRSTVANVTQIDGNPPVYQDYDITSFKTVAGEELLMVVNERISDATFHHYTVTLDSANATLQQVFAKGPVTIKELLSGTTQTTCLSLSACSFTTEINPGDGKLYQLQSALSADISIPRDSYNNPVNQGKSIKATVTIKNLGTSTWSTASYHVGVHVFTPSGTSIAQAAGVTGNNFAQPVGPGATATLTLTIPTGTGTSFTENGTYKLTLDVYQDGTPQIWFNNGRSFFEMVVPGPLLTDTFDSVPFNRPTSALWKWARDDTTHTGAPSHIRADALALNGQGSVMGAWGSSWSNYVFELDVMIDKESSPDNAYVGWRFRNGYMFQLAANSTLQTPNQLRRNIEDILAGTVPTGLTITPGTWYHIKEEVTGNTIKTWIKPREAGGAPVLIDTWTDSTYSTGGIGLRLNEDTNQGVNLGNLCDNDHPCPFGQSCINSSCWLFGVYNERAHFDNVSVYSTTLDSSAPLQVTGVATTAISNYLAIAWSRDTSSTGAKISHYRLYRGTSANFNPNSNSLIAEPAGTTYADLTVVPGTTYYYKVKAVSHANVEGAVSSAASGVAASLPANVKGLSATADDMKTVTLSWSGSAAKYNVHRGSPGFVPSESNRIATVSTTSHRDTSANMFASNSNVGLSGFQTYAYAVVAVSNTGGVPSAAPPSVTITTPGAKVFSDGFDSVSDSQWVPYSGTWTISGSAYNQTTANCGPGCIIPAMTAISGRTWGDMVAEFTVKITDNGGNSQNWAGLAFHKTNQADGLLVSGYLVFLRSDGTLELLESSLGQLDQMSTGLGPFNTPRRIRIETNQRYVRVFVDGILFIDWPEGTPLDVSDFNTPSWPTPGYVDLTTYGVQAQYLDMSIFFHDSFNRSFTFASGSPSSNWKLLPATSSYDVDRPNQLRLKPDGILQWTTPQALFVKDFTADFTVRIESPVNQTDWGGFTFRKQNQDDDSFVGGYTVFLRANGELDLFKAVVGTVATATVAPCPAAGQGCTSSPCAHQIRVSAVGNRIRVYSDGVQLIDWTDAASTYLQGYTSLAAYGSGNGTSCRFEGIEVF